MKAISGEMTAVDLNDNFSEVDTRLYSVEEKLSAPEYSAELTNDTSIFSTGTGKDANGNTIDVNSNIVNGQISDLVLKGNTRTNLLTENQASIETDKTGFAIISTGVTFSRDTIEKVYGSASLKVVTDGSTTNQGARTFGTKASNGKTYTASFYVKAPVGDYQVLLRNGAGGEIFGSAAFTGNGVWQRVNVTFTASADTDDLNLFIRTASTLATTFYIDGLMVEEGTEVKPFIIGTKSTLSVRAESVGKNEVNINGRLEKGYLSNDGISNVARVDSIFTTSNSITYKLNTGYSGFVTYAKVLPNTNYYLNWDNTQNATAFNISGVYKDGTLEQITTSENVPFSFNVGKFDEIALGGYYEGSTNGIECIVSNLQLEKGTVATAYESYKHSDLYTNKTLRSLPNGTKDEVNITQGKHYQRVSDELSIPTSGWVKHLEGTDTISFKINLNKTDGVVYNADLIPDINTTLPFTVKTWTKYYGEDTESMVWNYNQAEGFLYVRILKSKLSTQDSVGFEQWLSENYSNATLTYQLESPIVTDIDVTPLQAFPNGTISIEPYMQKSYTTSTTTITLDYPIVSIDTLKDDNNNEIDGTLASDGATITVPSAGTYYVEGVVRSEYSTIPTTVHSVPLNRNAQMDDNTAMIRLNSMEILRILARMEAAGV